MKTWFVVGVAVVALVGQPHRVQARSRCPYLYGASWITELDVMAKVGKNRSAGLLTAAVGFFPGTSFTLIDDIAEYTGPWKQKGCSATLTMDPIPLRALQRHIQEVTGEPVFKLSWKGKAKLVDGLSGWSIKFSYTLKGKLFMNGRMVAFTEKASGISVERVTLRDGSTLSGSNALGLMIAKAMKP